MRQQQLLQLQQQQLQVPQQPMVPQPTGFGYVASYHFRGPLSNLPRPSSNNPFAPPMSNPGFGQSPSPGAPSPVSFNLQGTYANGTAPSLSISPPPSSHSAPPSANPSGPKRVATRADQEHAHLANLFANRDDDGIDTFGNIGQLRYVVKKSQPNQYSCMIVQFRSTSWTCRIQSHRDARPQSIRPTATTEY